LQSYAPLIKLRYGFDTADKDAVGVIEAIAAKRGYRLKGGAVDFEKACITLLQDYRLGTLGRISLETPKSRAAMLALASETVTTLGTTENGIDSLGDD
jgi:ribosome biogenesis GTPase A